MSETMEITTKPAQNLAAILANKWPEILAAAAPNVKADGNWLARTKLEILSKPDVAAVLSSQKGISTALTAIVRAATVGLNFGGSKPQAYFVPTDGGLRLDVSQFGYCAVARYGPGAVLSQVPELIVVHQNDGLRIDQGTGQILFPEGGIDPFSDRGPLVGWVMRLDFEDDRQSEVRYATLAEVQKIAKDHGNVNAPSYKKDEPQMLEKIAVKQLLKRVFAEAEARSNANLADLMDEPKPEPTIERDPSKRMGARMAKATEGMRSVQPEPEEPAEEPEPETTHEPEQGAGVDGKEELF